MQICLLLLLHISRGFDCVWLHGKVKKTGKPNMSLLMRKSSSHLLSWRDAVLVCWGVNTPCGTELSQNTDTEKKIHTHLEQTGVCKTPRHWCPKPQADEQRWLRWGQRDVYRHDMWSTEHQYKCTDTPGHPPPLSRIRTFTYRYTQGCTPWSDRNRNSIALNLNLTLPWRASKDLIRVKTHYCRSESLWR